MEGGVGVGSMETACSIAGASSGTGEVVSWDSALVSALWTSSLNAMKLSTRFVLLLFKERALNLALEGWTASNNSVAIRGVTLSIVVFRNCGVELVMSSSSRFCE